MSLPAAVVLHQQEIDALESGVSMIAARLNQAHADLVALTVRLLEDERWAGDGIRSPEHWLVVHAGLSPARAGEVVRLARRAEALPTTMTALAAGQLSMDQAAVVARYAPSSHEQSIGELAPMTTVPQLRRALSRYQFATTASAASEAPDSAEPTETTEPTAENPPPADPLGRDERDVPGTEAFALKAAELSMSYADGRFLLRYSGPADVGALVEQAIREAKDALFAAGQTTATYADGLAEVAARSLASVESESRAARYRVYLHLSTDGAWVGGRGAIPVWLAAKYTCDGVVQPVWEKDGTPVSVGRKQRSSPARTRRLVEDRDRGCVFPGCQATRFLEVHHLDHWSKGGATDVDRLVCLCPGHHDGHHRGEFTITGDPAGGLEFTNCRGLLIRPNPDPNPDPHPRRATGESREPTDPTAYQGPTGERLQTRWLDLAPNAPTLTLVPDCPDPPDDDWLPSSFANLG